MRYFTPRFKIATLAPPQDRLLSKIGGIPWGFPVDLWPTCCGYPQKLLAQLLHEPPMLDLGTDRAVLHLFQCLECDGFTGSGRAALILPQSILGHGLSTVDGYDHPCQLGGPLIGEAWIVGWDQEDDGIPDTRLPDFFDDEKHNKLQEEFRHVEWIDLRQETKFGGSPRWTPLGPTRFPPPPFQFLFQLGNDLFVKGPPPAPNAVGCTVRTNPPKGQPFAPDAERKPSPHNVKKNAPWYLQHNHRAEDYYFEYTNLASDGTAFVFIDRTQQPHRFQWFYNR